MKSTFSSGISATIRNEQLSDDVRSIEHWRYQFENDNHIPKDEISRFVNNLEIMFGANSQHRISGKEVASLAEVFTPISDIHIGEPVLKCEFSNDIDKINIIAQGNVIASILSENDRTIIRYSDSYFQDDLMPTHEDIYSTANRYTGLPSIDLITKMQACKALEAELIENVNRTQLDQPTHPNMPQYLNAYITEILNTPTNELPNQIQTIANDLKVQKESVRNELVKLPTQQKSKNFQYSLSHQNLNNDEKLMTITVSANEGLKGIPTRNQSGLNLYSEINNLALSTLDHATLNTKLDQNIAKLQEVELQLFNGANIQNSTTVGHVTFTEAERQQTITGIELISPKQNDKQQLHRDLVSSSIKTSNALAQYQNAMTDVQALVHEFNYELQQDNVSDIFVRDFNHSILNTAMAHQKHATAWTIIAHQSNGSAVTSSPIENQSSFCQEFKDKIDKFENRYNGTIQQSRSNKIATSMRDYLQLSSILKMSIESGIHEIESISHQLSSAGGAQANSRANFKHTNDALRFVLANMILNSDGKVIQIPPESEFMDRTFETAPIVNNIHTMKASSSTYNIVIQSEQKTIGFLEGVTLEQIESHLNSSIAMAIKNQTPSHGQANIEVANLNHHYHAGQAEELKQTISQIPKIIKELNYELQIDTGINKTMVFNQQKHDGSQRLGVTQDGYDALNELGAFRACVRSNLKLNVENEITTVIRKREGICQNGQLVSITNSNGILDPVVDGLSVVENSKSGTSLEMPMLFKPTENAYERVKAKSDATCHLKVNNALIVKLSQHSMLSQMNIDLELIDRGIIDPQRPDRSISTYLNARNNDALIITDKTGSNVIVYPTNEQQIVPLDDASLTLHPILRPGIKETHHSSPILRFNDDKTKEINYEVVQAVDSGIHGNIFEVSKTTSDKNINIRMEKPLTAATLTPSIRAILNLPDNVQDLYEAKTYISTLDAALRYRLSESIKQSGHDTLIIGDDLDGPILCIPTNINEQIQDVDYERMYEKFTQSMTAHLDDAFVGEFTFEPSHDLNNIISQADTYCSDLHPTIKELVTKTIDVGNGKRINVVFHGSPDTLEGDHYSMNKANSHREAHGTGTPQEEGMYYAAGSFDASLYARSESGSFGTMYIAIPSIKSTERVIVADAENNLSTKGVTALTKTELTTMLKHSPILQSVGLTDQRMNTAVSKLDGLNINKQLKVLDNIFWPQGASGEVRALLRDSIGIAGKVTLKNEFSDAIAVEFPSKVSNPKIFASLDKTGNVSIENTTFDRNATNWRMCAAKSPIQIEKDKAAIQKPMIYESSPTR